MPTNTAIITIITALVLVMRTHADIPTGNAPPPLLDRLPPDIRAPPVAITVAEHDVCIRTTNGKDLILLRLSDALRKVGTTPGLQVHRTPIGSRWPM
jgi:hypothetical protein